MQKLLFYTALCTLALAACDNKSDNIEKNEIKQEVVVESNIREHIKSAVSKDLLRNVAANQDNFQREFNKLNPAQQYYFCAAFTMGAMSVAKPITASAMVNYFMGLGVVQYNRGIDEQTYMAFDFGKNIFHFDKAINTILQEKICENIIGAATKSAKTKKMSTKEISNIGNAEVKKIIKRIKK